MSQASRRAIFVAPLLATLPSWRLPVQAKTAWPTEPIRLVVPTGPGSGSDVIARGLSGFLARELGQAVVVDNRPGGGGIIAHESVMRPPLNGHTFLLSSTSAFFVVPFVNTAARYRYADFVPVAAVGRAPFAVLVSTGPSSPKTLGDLLASLRSRPQSYSSTGIGALTHLGSEQLIRLAGVSATHVPYRGSGQSLADLIGGQVAFSTDSLTAAMPLIRTGRLRALVVLSSVREAALPDVPTSAEVGFPDLQVAALAGVFAPKGTPLVAINKMAAAVADSLKDSEILHHLAAQETIPLQVSPADFDRMMRTDAPRWERVVKQLGITAN